MEFWQVIKELEGQTLETLDRGHHFVILDVSDHLVVVRPNSTNKERIILRKEIEGTYKELSVIGHISRSQIEARHSPRNPAYVAALLAELEGVLFSIRPIELRIKSRDILIIK